MKIKCIIIDDEPLAIKVIVTHLKEMPEMELVATFNSPLDALPLMTDDAIDVLFLDINMPKMNGLDFLRTLTNKPHVIITTAYREFAVDSFDLDVLDYLVKPIPFGRFLKTINKLSSRILLERAGSEDVALQVALYLFKG